MTSHLKADTTSIQVRKATRDKLNRLRRRAGVEWDRDVSQADFLARILAVIEGGLADADRCPEVLRELEYVELSPVETVPSRHPVRGQ